MERYNIINEVGNGTFGNVWRAINMQTAEVVAIKKMKRKYYSWEECINLREVKSLRKMSHSNIVKLKEVIREKNNLYFVFEYMECNLYQLMKDRRKLFSETEVKNWCFQVFQGLAYMQKRGYFHRDLKPENLLVSKDMIKIADFGLAREINSSPPYTEYVSTRWYRAPEVLLMSPAYGSAVDMWAMGAIIAELLTLQPLFPGSRMYLYLPDLGQTYSGLCVCEADEIYKICSVIGSPTKIEWAEGLELASAVNFQFPKLAGVPLSILLPSASKDAISLITSLCSWDPCKRPTASEALRHPFFQSCYYIPPSLRSKPAVVRTPPSGGIRGLVEQKHAGNLSYCKPQAVQRKLEMDYQGATKYDKTLKNTAVEPPLRYRPPVRNSPTEKSLTVHTWKAHKVSNTAEKLAYMKIGKDKNKKPPRQQMPPPMKAGGWDPQSDPFLGRSQDFNHGRAYSRKVAG